MRSSGIWRVPVDLCCRWSVDTDWESEVCRKHLRRTQHTTGRAAVGPCLPRISQTLLPPSAQDVSDAYLVTALRPRRTTAQQKTTPSQRGRSRKSSARAGLMVGIGCCVAGPAQSPATVLIGRPRQAPGHIRADGSTFPRCNVAMRNRVWGRHRIGKDVLCCDVWCVFVCVCAALWWPHAYLPRTKYV